MRRAHVRLDRAISKLGPASRAEARRLIDEGRGRVHGKVVRNQRLAVRKRSNRETHLLVTLTEGRNREVRRLFAAVGHEVTKLKRVAFGSIELGTLQSGQWREITREEVGAALGSRV